jgi:hypothetical protein
MPPSIEHVKTGKLRGLAATTATRPEALRDMRTVGEFVINFNGHLPWSICSARLIRPSALHVVERYRLIAYEAARQAQQRAERELFHVPQASDILHTNIRSKLSSIIRIIPARVSASLLSGALLMAVDLTLQSNSPMAVALCCPCG